MGAVNPLLPLICSVPSSIHRQDTNSGIGSTMSPCFYHIALLVQWSWTAIPNTSNKTICKYKQQPKLILLGNLCTQRLGRVWIIWHTTHMLSKILHMILNSPLFCFKTQLHSFCCYRWWECNQTVTFIPLPKVSLK